MEPKRESLSQKRKAPSFWDDSDSEDVDQSDGEDSTSDVRDLFCPSGKDQPVVSENESLSALSLLVQEIDKDAEFADEYDVSRRPSSSLAHSDLVDDVISISSSSSDVVEDSPPSEGTPKDRLSTNSSPDLHGAVEVCSTKTVIPDPGASKANTSLSENDRFAACCGVEELFLLQKQTPSLSSKVLLNLADTKSADDVEFFGLGQAICQAIFNAYDIVSLHDWQTQMLQSYIEDEKNALVIAPTSGGKTLVALVLMLRAMVLGGKDCILVLPYVAIVSEKVQELRRLAKDLHWLSVAEYAGSKGVLPLPKRKATMRSLYVSTPEKATGIWKMLCEDGDRREEIGVVAIDECHMIRDNPRGAVIEELIVSMLFRAPSSLRIVALSATVGNPDVIATFLGGGDPSKCRTYNVATRPTKMKEMAVVSGAAIPIVRNDEVTGSLQFSDISSDILDEVEDQALLECPSLVGTDEQVCAKLVFESVRIGDSVLIFCGTRKMCVSVCEMLTNAQKSLRNVGYLGSEVDAKTDLADEIRRQRNLIIGHLQSEGKGMVGQSLLAGIAEGIAYHSAELHPTERLAVEDAFRRNILYVICCTSTLAAGVNLPANRVIIRSPRVGSSLVSCGQYLQMIGRAGRTRPVHQRASAMQPDSFIFVQAHDVAPFQSVIQQPVEDVISQLAQVVSFYQRRTTESRHSDPCTGITRVLLGAMLMKGAPMRLSELIAVYKLTLLYQTGKIVLHPESRKVLLTLHPLINELKVLLELGSIEPVMCKAHQAGTIELKLVCDKDDTDIVMSTEDVKHQSGHNTENQSEDFVRLSEPELAEFSQILASGLEGDVMSIPDYYLRLSLIAAAATAASMSVTDAVSVVKEAEHLEVAMPLCNPLAILYLTITGNMSMQLIQEEQFKSLDNSRRVEMIKRKLLRDFKSHPDVSCILMLGLNEELLTEWVYGNPTIRRDSEFNHKLCRLWSSIFIKEVLTHPDQTEVLCESYGFDRPAAHELSAVLATRCQNLKVLFLKLERFWWYPPLAGKLMKSLGESCDKHLRPFLQLRHMTIERAKHLFDIGLKSIQDVAAIFPPTVLSDSVPHMSRWMASEIILSARDLVFHEAALHEAESQDRKRTLERS